MLVRVVKMTFRDDAIEEFKTFFEGRKKQIRNFEGCMHLELWQDRLHPAIFFTYSHWVSADALDAYRHSSFFADTWQQTKQLFAGKPEAWSINQVVVLP
ncbi:putative quinol monooxygenase [Aridibaculum aurantiacum]|uniref:putative quinol monooxygenase n=1 Tax=Aridibaculum aurantiacum TaxID=2810307 RepID=UPI001A97ADB0|nr:antibiotic biosynthesis monooxygenase family protein [Aridibaculum aurantiacum]